VNHQYRRRAGSVTSCRKAVDNTSLRVTIEGLQRSARKKEVHMPDMPDEPRVHREPEVAFEVPTSTVPVERNEPEIGDVVLCKVGINCQAASSAEIVRFASDAVGKILEALWTNVERPRGSMVYLMAVVER